MLIGRHSKYVYRCVCSNMGHKPLRLKKCINSAKKNNIKKKFYPNITANLVHNNEQQYASVFKTSSNLECAIFCKNYL